MGRSCAARILYPLQPRQPAYEGQRYSCYSNANNRGQSNKTKLPASTNEGPQIYFGIKKTCISRTWNL